MVRKVNRSGTITTVVGSGIEGFSGDGGPATQADFWGLSDVAVDSTSSLEIGGDTALGAWLRGWRTGDASEFDSSYGSRGRWLG